MDDSYHLDRVKQYINAKRYESGRKDIIAQQEEDLMLFYKHQYEREEISAKQYAESLKERSERYAQYAQEVLAYQSMSESEKAELSRKYLQESEKALTDHIKITRNLEKQAEKERQEERKAALKEIESAMELSRKYVSDRNYYSSWEEVGDDPISAFGRVDSRLSDAVLEGKISYKDYYNQLSEFGSYMYNDRIANSNRWLDHEREMNRISAEDYIDGLYRMKDYTQEYYSAGIISHRQYIDGMRYLEERIFNERKSQHQEILRQAEEEKSAVDETAKAKIKALEEQYKAAIAEMDEDDRQEEYAYLKAQEKIYANAQTKEGKDRLAQIREDMENIRDEERRIALKENLEAEKEAVLSKAERKKSSIDRRAAAAAIDLGLYYDEDTGYRMRDNANSALSGVLTAQTEFSEKSSTQMDNYNSQMLDKMNTSMQTLASGILTNFQAFASGVSAIKNQIFSDVASINSLDFSRFGASGGRGNTTITYNDYGDKNLSGTGYAASVFDEIKNLIAKGGKI